MATNNIEYTVRITEKGLRITQKGVKDLGTTLKSTEKNAKTAGAAIDEVNYKTNQGVIGSSSAARSFSKLNQTIGRGPNSLVSAYATLAANTFAVVAAFNALREAAGVEQVLKGLEVQGAKTGRTLSLAAKELQNITGNAISSADALKATAQVTSAGFGAKELEQLGTVATDAALALGRSIPDAMERVTRGITKLEPELLDELGLMTKLTEASEKYALANNKTVTSLSSFEKRQAFLNAIVEEGTLKFAGIKDEIGTNPYDRLSASFNNLVKEMLSYANVVGKFVANIAGLNEGVLLGGMLLFASTISRQVLPMFYELSAASVERRDKLLEEAKVAKETAKQSVLDAKATRERTLSKARDIKVLDSYPAKFKAVAQSIREGTLETSKFDAEILRLKRSIDARQGQIDRGFYGGDKAKIAAQEANIAALVQTRDKLISLKEVETKYHDQIITSTKESIAARTSERVLRIKASAEDTRARAIEAAGNLDIKRSWESMTQSVRQYALAVALARKQQVGTDGVVTGFATAMDRAKVAAFGLGTGIRAFGAGLIRLLPQLGLVSIGISILNEAYDKLFKTDADRAKEKALNDYIEVVKSTDDKIKALVKTQQSLGAQANITTQYLVAQGNTITELSDAALQAIKDAQEVIKKEQEGTGVSSLFKAMIGDSSDISSYLTGVAKDSDLLKPFEDQISKNRYITQGIGKLILPGGDIIAGLIGPLTNGFGTINKESAASIKALEQLSKVVGKDLFDSLVKAHGGMDKIVTNNATKASFIKEVADAYKNNANQVSSLAEAFKQAETAATEFIRSAAIGTQYDKLTSSVQSVNSALTQLSYNSTISDADLGGLISGIGPDLQRFLDPIAQQELNSIKNQHQIKQNLSEMVNLGIELNSNQQQQLDKAERALRVFASTGSSLRENLRTLEDQLEIAQQDDRLNKGKIDHINAIKSAYSSAYSEGAAAMKAQIEREKQIKDLEVARLSRQLNFLKNIYATSEAKLKDYKQDLMMDEERAKRSREESKANIQRIEELARKTKLLSEATLDDPEGSFGRLSLWLTDIQKSLLKSLITNRESLAVAEKQLELNSNIAVLENSMADTKASIQSIAQQITNIEETRLNQGQEAAKIAEAELKLRQQLKDLYYDNKKGVDTLARSQKKFNDLASGFANTALYGINDILADTKETLDGIAQDGDRDIKAIKTAISTLEADRKAAMAKGHKLEADALKEQIDARNVALEQRILERDIATQQALVQEKILLLEQALMDPRTEGLEIQKKSLEALTAYNSEKQKSLSLDQQITSLNKEIEALRNNSPISEKAQKALAYEAAKQQLDLAKDQFDLKVRGIELEYAVLEAQRLALVEELRAKKAILIETAKLQGADTSYLNNIANQLQTSMDNISTRSYEEVKQLAVSNARKELEVLERQTEKARLEFLNVFKPESFIDKMKQGIADAVTTATVLTNSKRSASEAKTALSPIVEPITNLTTAIYELKDVQKMTVDELRKRLDKSQIKDLAETSAQSAIGVVTKGTAMKGTITGLYGENRGTHNHAGVDIAMPVGSQISSTISGTVTGYTGRRGAYGNIVEILDETTGLSTRFAHLSEILVKVGQRVEKGQLIGLSGGAAGAPGSGRSTGPHLHYEERVNGATRNPYPGAVKGGTGGIGGLGPAKAIEELMSEGPLLAGVRQGEFDQELAKIAEAQQKIKMSAFDAWQVAYTGIQPYMYELRKLGPDGEVVVAVMEGINRMVYSVKSFTEDIKQNGLTLQNLGSIVSAALSTITSITSAASAARIANIDREIEAEQRRDGKSSESVVKLQEMEKKKDAIAKKQFNLNKKLSMAQAVIATATGVAEALKLGPIAGPILAGLIGAMGAAQLAIISKTQYQSSASNIDAVSTPASLSIGKRGDSIDLAQGPNRNAGGELGYLRGSSGYGTNANDFRTIGSAYGGKLNRGYGNRGFVVGEKGPEVIEPDVPISVTPADEVKQAPNINATFEIKALDAKGVEQILLGQKGNIISMLRDAANSNGQRFLEDVDVNVYNTNLSKL